MDQPDFRALTHELNALLVYLVSTHPNLHETVIRAYLYCSGRATAALATPEPEPPTKEDLMQLACKYFDFRGNSQGGFFFATSIEAKTYPYQSLTSFAHDILERWGK